MGEQPHRPQAGTDRGAPPDGAAGAPEGILGRARGVITAPVPTFRGVARDAPLGQALGVVLIVFVLSSVVQSLGFATDPEGLPQVPRAMTVVGGLVIGLPAALLSFVVWTALVLLCARLLGGRGDFRGTLSGLGFAYVPVIFGVIVAALALPVGATAGPVVVLAFLGTALWSLALDVIAVREVHDVTTGRAVGAVLLPVVALGVLGALLFLTLVATLLTGA